ncbi:MAG: hypothetical protein GXC78_05480 [Chitinophagaceae bacterium]|nr:hypothetical protein [Chitinophagaceae bacterium]
MKNKRPRTNQFKQAVENTPEVKNAHQEGLQAFKKDDRNKIELNNPKLCEGSVDIDTTVTTLYPQSNRWDYCLSYDGEVFFVEVHSANTSEVSTVIRKLQWLTDWLNNQAPRINALQAKRRHPFYWIQSNGFHILKTSSQFRQAIQHKIKPVAKLKL